MTGRYPTDDDVFTVFPSRRSVVHGTKGIVSTASPLATEAGLRILREGGNAADAAIAAAAVLNLVDPSMTGIGGDVFALFYEAETKEVRAVNGSGRSPAGATLEGVCEDLAIADREFGAIPLTSAHAVTVPGAAAAWVDMVERLGSGKVSLGQVLAPAIELAEEGAPISEISSYHWVSVEKELRGRPNGTDLLKPDPQAPGGFRAPRPGELYRSPLLAKTLRALGEHGKRGFYEGPVAEAVVEIVQSLGGHLSLQDMKWHGDVGSEFTEAVPLRLATDKGNIDLWEHPPNGQGIVAQIALGILQELEKEGKLPRFGPEDHNSPKYLHALIYSLRTAFATGTSLISDPSTTSTDPKSLLTPSHLATLTTAFHPTRATTPTQPATPRKTSDTIYLAVTDADGNACSFVNSVADLFGAQMVPRGVGFVLQCRGSGFHLGPAGHPNVFAPGKRPYNTIIPALVTHADDDDDGGLHTVLGVMGGAMQPQGHVQVLLNMVAFGMNPQVALDAPRVCVGVALPGKSTDPGKKVDESVYLEEGIGEEVAEALEEMGYEVKFVKGMGRSLFGRGQVIRAVSDPVDGRRVYSAGSDMRGDGYAAPLL